MPFNTDNLITAVATVSAAGVSGLLAFFTARSSARVSALQRKHAELRAQHLKVLAQVEAFHALEGLYAGEHELLGAGTQMNVKTEFRNRVESAGFVRPTMTALEARKRIIEIEGTAAE